MQQPGAPVWQVLGILASTACLCAVWDAGSPPCPFAFVVVVVVVAVVVVVVDSVVLLFVVGLFDPVLAVALLVQCTDASVWKP